MNFVEPVHDIREIISQLLSVVDAPERIRPAAEDSGLSTVGAFWLLAVTAYFSRPALVAGSWGIVLIAGPSSLDTIPITIPACAGIEVRIGAALVAVGVTVAIIFGRIRSRAGMSPSLGKSHLSYQFDKMV